MKSTLPAADRVHTAPYTVGTCPVCEEAIAGDLTVAIYLGDVTVTTDDENKPPTAEVAVETKLRRLRVVHDCRDANAEAHARTDLDQEQ